MEEKIILLEDIIGIKLQGANFFSETELKLFTSKRKQKACLMYGKNGSGKSTISRAFNKVKGNEEEAITLANLIDPSSNVVDLADEDLKQIFIFNEDYIDCNIRLNKEGLNTIVVLGEQKQLEDQINKAKEQRKKATEKVEKQEEICKRYNDEKEIISPNYYKKIMSLSLKGDGNWADRDSKIKGNKQASAVRNDTYEQFIKRQPNKTRDELLIEFNQKFSEYEAAKSGAKRIHNAVKTDFKFSFDETVFKALLSKKIEEPNLSDREKFLLNLVSKKGQPHLHEMKEYFTTKEHNICPYCLQVVSGEYKKDLFLSIEKILSKASKEHQDELSKYHREEININFDYYNELDKTMIIKCQECLDEFNKSIKIVNEAIIRKKENVYSPIIIEELHIFQKFDALICSLSALEKLRIEFNKDATDIASRQVRLTKINNDIAFYDIKENYQNYQKQLSLKLQENKRLHNYSEELMTWNNKVNELEIQKKNIRIAMESINSGLRYIFFSENRLSIEYRKEKYYLLSRGNSVTPQEISVGERNAIALCYFFTNIMKNQEEREIYKNEHLLIIDDPVSSFDIENRVGILSYLKYQLQRFLCGNINTKVLVMTHEIQTFYDIKKLLEEIMVVCKESFGSSNKYTFSIYELTNKELHEFKFKDRNEYTALMEKIFDYALGQTPEYELVIGNSMRRVLEAFSTFIYKKGIEKVSTDPKIMSKIESPYNVYFEHLMYRLVLHGGSHSEENIKALGSMDFFDYISDEEKQRTAKDVLCFIYLLNKVHVLEHLSRKSNVQSTLDSWLENIKMNY